MSKSESQGFSLLELLVVMVIIGLMSALAVPKLTGSLSNMDLKNASKKISASLRYARSQAASEKATYTTLFDFDNNRVSISSGRLTPEEPGEEPTGGDEGSTGRAKVYDLPDGVMLEKAISGEDEIDSGLFQVVFFPAGSSSGGEVIIGNHRGNRYRVSVDFITGAVMLSSEK
ncbi:MAG: prepilin-type N-terminal cleavage/methylation domain-containing protein [Thermodesulfobacteriota bacterium]|nr:prepilin-type N-terminal cleavage/methylation domain-containing protein [Thermodesulfobacteriota bacterium]